MVVWEEWNASMKDSGPQTSNIAVRSGGRGDRQSKQLKPLHSVVIMEILAISGKSVPPTQLWRVTLGDSGQ